MAGSTIPITLTERQLSDIQRVAGAGKSESIAAFLQDAILLAIAETKTFEEMMDEVMEETGGPPTAQERAWVDSILRPDQPSKTKKKKKAA